MPELLPDGPIDTLGVLDGVLAAPEQLTEALDAGPVRDLPAVTHLDHVVVAAPVQVLTAGEIVGALAAPVASVPVLAHGGDRLPAFVSTRSLVMVVSVDDDGAALDTARDAHDRGATVLAVTPEASDLAAIAREADGLVVPAAIDVPVARLAAGPLAVHALAVLEQLGLFAELGSSVAAAVAQLERRRAELTAAGGPAARLARRIDRTLPIVYGTDHIGGVAARHWKRRVNLDAKAAAFAATLPELGWADVSGWGQHGDMTRQVFSLVTLRHDHEPAGVDARMRIVDDLLDEVVHDRHEVAAAGEGALAQLLDLVFQADVTCWHLAQHLEIDPGPTAAISAVRSSA